MVGVDAHSHVVGGNTWVNSEISQLYTLVVAGFWYPGLGVLLPRHLM